MPTATFVSCSEMYAHSQGFTLDGPDRCHWCTSPCKKLIPHDDARPIPGQRYFTSAKLPGNQYMCVGCWLWRRKRITIHFLTEGLKDGQAPENWNWWLEPTIARAIRLSPISKAEPYTDKAELIERLLDPPHVFGLALAPSGNKNWLHQIPLNQNSSIRADTELYFASEGKTFHYTVYELEVAMKEGPEGTEAGVQELCRILGIQKPIVDGLAEKIEVEESERKGPGRPPALINLARKNIKGPDVSLSGIGLV